MVDMEENGSGKWENLRKYLFRFFLIEHALLLVFGLFLFLVFAKSYASSPFGGLEAKAGTFQSDKGFFSPLMRDLGEQVSREAQRIGETPEEIPQMTLAVREKFINDFLNEAGLSGIRKIYLAPGSDNCFYLWVLSDKVDTPTMFKFHFNYTPEDHFHFEISNFQLGPIGITPELVGFIPMIAADVVNRTIGSFEEKYQIKIQNVRTEEGRLLISFGAVEKTAAYPDFGRFASEAAVFRPVATKNFYQLYRADLLAKANRLLSGLDKDDMIELRATQGSFNNLISQVYLWLLPEREMYTWVNSDLVSVPILARWELAYSRDLGPQIELLNLQLGKTPLPTSWFAKVVEDQFVTKMVRDLIQKNEKQFGLSVVDVRSGKGEVIVRFAVTDPHLVIEQFSKN